MAQRGSPFGELGRHLPREPSLCVSLRSSGVVAGNLESNQMGFKRLMSGREKEKYKALYKTMRNVIVGALNCRGINLDQREVNFHTPPTPICKLLGERLFLKF